MSHPWFTTLELHSKNTIRPVHKKKSSNTKRWQACVDEMQRIVDSTRQRQQQLDPVKPPSPAAPPASPPSSTSPSAAVYDEMLQDCRRKAGEVTLDRLRKLCQKLSRPNANRDDDGGRMGGEGGTALGEEETVVVSYHAALLGKAEGATNIYGG